MDNIWSFQEIKIQSKFQLLPNNPDGESGDTGDQIETLQAIDLEEPIEDATVSPTQTKEEKVVTVDVPDDVQTVTDSTLGAETDTKVDVQSLINEEDNMAVGTKEELAIEE